MAIQRHSSLYTFTLQPGAGKVLPQVIPGQYWSYVEGTGPILVRLDEQPASLIDPGVTLFAGEGQQFDRFEMSNPTGLAMTIVVWIGYTDRIDRRRNQIEAPTEFVPVPSAAPYVGGVLAATSQLDLPGNPTTTRIRRKAIVVVNLDPAIALELCDAAGVVGAVVRATESVTLPISGFVRIKNSSGAPVACHLSEIWWNP